MLNFCLEKKNYLRCLRFWFGGDLERELGEAFSGPQFTVRESEVSNEDFFVRLPKHSQMASFTLFFFFFFLRRSSLVRNGSGMFVPSYFLLIFSLNPFINLLVMV